MATWLDIILDSGDAQATWAAIFAELGRDAPVSVSPAKLNEMTVIPDRLLAESAWELWQQYGQTAWKTSTALKDWWQVPSASGKAVLILDALSLRELPALLAGAEAHGIVPTQITVTGAEVPADTDTFAKALGVSSRGSLANNRTPGGFALGPDVYTDVMPQPFTDCVGGIPNERNLFIWHTWPDMLIHQSGMTHTQLSRAADTELCSDGFWTLVDRVRQGRRLLITADHGYAVSQLFATEERDAEVISALRATFGASRYKDTPEAWQHTFMPPPVIQGQGALVVIGQRKWPVSGGFPKLTHGGMSLLEVAVPFIELPPQQ